MDREGSKSQLRHTEPPREKKKNKNGGNVSSEKFVQQLLDNTFQQEQQQSGMRFSLRGKYDKVVVTAVQNTETGYVL